MSLTSPLPSLIAPEARAEALSCLVTHVIPLTTSWGLPWVAIVTSSAFGLLGYMAVSTGAGKVFGWFANMTAIAGLMTWFGIAVTYIRFHAGLKAQGIDRNTLPFKSPLQPFLAYYVVVSTLVICFVSIFLLFSLFVVLSPSTRTDYLPFPPSS